MARKLIVKQLNNTRLASGYGGWIYCDNCGENIGYLCYVTYDNLKLEYRCKCGNQGSMHISFNDVEKAEYSNDKLVSTKSRLCCPTDQSPLLTILEKKLSSYNYEIDCVICKTRYKEEKTL